MKALLLTLSLATTIIPFEREITRLPKPSFLQSQTSSSGNYFEDFAGNEKEELFYQGFSFMNSGPNVMVPTAPQDLDYAYRNFSFTTEDHAKRDTYLWLTDYNGSGYMSDMYESVMVFLPRENQFAIEEQGDETLVTLPTGEEVVFSTKKKTILRGVLSEEPLDYNPDRIQRHFARVSYHGTGLVIRSDVRASDPRLAKKTQVLRAGKSPCEVSTELFWTKEDFPQFKFTSDDEALAVVAKNCGNTFLE